MQMTMLRALRWHIVKARSPTMQNEEKPSPRGTFQRVFGGVFFQSVLRSLSGAVPLPLGPRKWGHHSLASWGLLSGWPREKEAGRAMTHKATKAIFMMACPITAKGSFRQD